MTSDSQLAMAEAPEIGAGIRSRVGSRRRVRNGKATNDLVLSASADGNDRMFPRILTLYVNDGSTVADCDLWQRCFLATCSPSQVQGSGNGHPGRRGLPGSAL
ncbi:MAG: hypothetical protein F4099_05120 [Synechococcus sp. SB0673_bin_10]|nr:hypothetical protein [Synechococcus sp. SB0667_bin_8]MXY62229.1 hypothetical protein [Synechococcus sp. SB0665_bin_28]MYF35535.1 hypothetical protein [Synechococcus sp. SB0678_bin_12]MYI71883.1 hypothetical protein [Synechococcus sp. SB0673_bin_10]MYI87097.1 hypothetical protein [Synechococcus sp. SB0672_bin_10]